MTGKQCQAGVSLAAAESNRVRRKAAIEESVRVELAISPAERVHRLELVKVDAHHAGADGAAPTMVRARFGTKSRISEGLLGSSQREAVRAGGKLEKFRIADNGFGFEAFDFSADSDREAAGVKIA